MVALTVPVILLVNQASQQFSWEMYFPYRWSAQQTLNNINEALHTRLSKESDRPIGHYKFYTVMENPLTKRKNIRLSPLTNTHSSSRLPGLIGYFQVDELGIVSSPLLPFTNLERLMQEKIDLKWKEIDRRLKLFDNIELILKASGFTRRDIQQGLMLISQNDLVSRSEVIWSLQQGEMERFIEMEAKADNASHTTNQMMSYKNQTVNVSPFNVHKSLDGHLIFYRSTQGEKSRLQGFVVNETEFLDGLIEDNLSRANFESDIILNISSGGQSLRTFSYVVGDNDEVIVNREPLLDHDGLSQHDVLLLGGTLLTPLDNMKVNFLAKGLPLGPATVLMLSLFVIVSVIISVGLILIYRLGSEQIRLADDRLNFVSSVSHELRTPLTSIIMYSEMLRENMVIDEAKRKNYYDFIFHESERLARLINNVLQLSRLGHSEQQTNSEFVNVKTLINIIQSKVSSLIEKNNFELLCSQSGPIDHQALIDLDAFSQIVINLVDNAIKFSSTEGQAYDKKIDINFCESDAYIVMSVRDYGPGLTPAQSKRVFELFYRAGSELTRTTTGTGIGLNLVAELAKDMGGYAKCNVKDPGLEIQVYFPSSN
ncbi:MAG: two-component system phosphate regulon sensor histidine kinase PhoR [Oceanicoccus sp.]|jgi:two-component system phosphate regulon sensor histidine kinase PhoR